VLSTHHQNRAIRYPQSATNTFLDFGDDDDQESLRYMKKMGGAGVMTSYTDRAGRDVGYEYVKTRRAYPKRRGDPASQPSTIPGDYGLRPYNPNHHRPAFRQLPILG
jgi:hypothetical protein